LVPLGLALQWRERAGPRRAFRLGYVTGAVFFLVLLYWIPFLPRENVTIPYLMFPMLLIMVAYLALFPAVSALIAVVLARRGLPVAFALPPLWVLFEVVRGTGMFGFPWGSIAYAPAGSPSFIQFAEYTGMWGVGLWILLVNGCLVHAICTPSRRTRNLSVLAAAALVILPGLHGTLRLRHAPPRPTVTVGLVQPNVGEDKWQLAARDSVVATVLRVTRELGEKQRANPPVLYVWPETAVPAPIRRDPMYRVQVKDLVEDLNVPLLAGFPDAVRESNGKVRFTNSAGLIMPGRGLVRQYDKRHLVPFSEYFPMPLLNRYDFGQANFAAGSELGLFTQLDVPFGVLICFESIFPDETRDLCRAGSRYIVNITNDQWFGDSAAPYQHFEMNVLRCIENNIGMARAANTGISAILDPYGRVVSRTGTFVPAGLVGKVELLDTTTFYTRHGDWVLGLCLIWVGLGLVPFRRRKRE
jgi:apolipoprotein N-acyltransferase